MEATGGVTAGAVVHGQTGLTRIHGSWLAHYERRLLLRLARAMPAWVTSDQLTIVGLGGALLTCVSYAGCQIAPELRWLACLGLVLNWFGDSLDGTLARHRGAERPRYGFFVDHSADVISQFLVFMGLGASPYMRFDIACLALLSYWLAALYTFIRAVATKVFQISYFGVGPTEIRLALLLYTIALPALGALLVPTPVGPFALIDIVVALIFCVVVVVFAASVWSEARRLAVLEPEPGPADQPEQLG